MKANNGLGNNESRDTWETPQVLWDKLNDQYNFTFDCCANIKNKKTLAFAKDFLQHNLMFTSRICWMNPPFSKAHEMFEHFFKAIPRGVAIYRCDNMETKIWQEVILGNVDWVFIPKGRICYEGMKGKGSRFPSALIGVNVEAPKGLNGIVLHIRNNKRI